MFWFITAVQTWQTSLDNAIKFFCQIKLTSGQNQNIKTSLQFIKKSKLGPMKTGLKYFFTHKNLPEKLQPFNYIYKKVRYTVLKISKATKPIVMSKGVSSTFSGLSTAALLSNANIVSLPILVPAATISALGNYAKEKRQETIALQEKKLEKQLAISYKYKQIPEATSLDVSGKVFGSEREISYSAPNVMEIIKVGLDVGLAGIVLGVTSPAFGAATVSYLWYGYSEYKQRKKMSVMKKKLHKSKTWVNKVKSNKYSSSKHQKS